MDLYNRVDRLRVKGVEFYSVLPPLLILMRIVYSRSNLVSSIYLLITPKNKKVSGHGKGSQVSFQYGQGFDRLLLLFIFGGTTEVHLSCAG